MDIKIEPGDELLSSHGTSGIDNDAEMNFHIFSEAHSPGNGFGVRVKQEEFDEEDFNKEGNPQTTITKSKDPIEPPAITSSQSDLPSTPLTNQKHFKKEFELQEVNAVIMLNNCVFFERNFVCKVCYDIFPSSHLLEQHVTNHALFKFDAENSEKLNTGIKIEPDNELPSSSNQGSCHIDSHRNNMIDILNEDHLIDIKHEALQVQEKITEHEKHHQSRKTKTLLHSGIRNFDNEQSTSRTAYPGFLEKHKIFHTEEKPFKRNGKKKKTAQSGKIKPHTMSDTGEKPFKCDQCNYNSFRSCNLERHKMSHTEEMPFKCDRCSYKSAYFSVLNTHKRSHTGEKPYKCDRCSYKSAYSGALKTHKMSHTGEKPFQCDQCSYRTAKSGYLKTHKMSHTGEKPFKCDQCNFKTSQSGSLKLHKMSHTGEKPFKCDQCNYKTIRSGDLTKHKKSHTRNFPGL